MATPTETLVLKGKPSGAGTETVAVYYGSVRIDAGTISYFLADDRERLTRIYRPLSSFWHIEHFVERGHYEKSPYRGMR
jgi:hypothetical protein